MTSTDLIGRQLVDITFPIDRSKIYELAASVQDPDAMYQLDNIAHAEDKDILAPINWPVLVTHWIDGVAVIGALGLDIRRVLHGGTEWHYHAPVAVGDRVTARQVVHDVAQREGKRGGLMTLITLETQFTNQRGELVCTELSTVIETSR